MSNLAQDIRIALRGFRRTPTFAITVLAILGLGIGASVATFTVFRSVLLQRLPVREPERLVVLTTYKDPTVEFGLQLKDLKQISATSRTMQGIAGYAHFGVAPSPMLDGDRALTMNRVMASGNFFDVLGAVPSMGRLLRPSDSDPGAAPVMVLSYNAWRHMFGGDPKIVGRHIVEPYSQWTLTIVGVAPAGLDYPAGADFWLPEPADAGGQSIIAIARLATGTTPDAARAELFGIMQRSAPEKELVGARVEDFSRAMLGDVRPVLDILTMAVALLLLIVCVNVGNLLLLRTASRSQEIAVRRALGAKYGDLVRQLLVEAALLAIGGGTLGLACAQALIRILLAYAPSQLPRTDIIALSGTPIATAIGVTAIAMLLFGVVPALIAARSNVATTLRLDSRSGGDTVSRRRIRQFLVAAQTMLALIMLAGSALLARSLARLEQIDLGYNADHLSFLIVSWPAAKIEGGPKLFPLGEETTRRWRAIPGVVAITPVMTPPLYGDNLFLTRLDREGQAPSELDGNPLFAWEVGDGDYFRTLGIPIVRGRGFLDSDREDAPHVAVVSEAVARRMWPGEDPLGKRIHAGPADTASWRTIVGVAADTHLRMLRSATPEVYTPWRQVTYWQFEFAVRTTGSLAAVLPALRRELRTVDPELTLWSAEPMYARLSGPLAQPKMSALLMSAFGIAALLLSALGLYGTTASTVRESTREIGIRMALGATPEGVQRRVLQQALLICGIGMVGGIAGALVGSRLLASQLYGVSPSDPIALVAACAVLIAVAFVAAYLPAHRATRIDPARALRAD
jgi:putative ABC transport system permease protein